jgi:lipopolysaccharide biosynthesis glycosyltransferase
MRILLTFDTGYAPHAATVMESIIQNCPKKLDFVVIYCDLTKEVKNMLSKHFEGKVNSLEFVQLEKTLVTDTVKNVKATVVHHWNYNAYLRLYAQMLLQDEYVIYMDCDTVVQDNILKILENADLTKPVCAVTEYNPCYKLRDLSNLKKIEKPLSDPLVIEAYWYRAYINLQMDPSDKYFCSGIMVLNLEYWRNNKIMEQTLDFLARYPERIFAVDQDALNHIIKGDYSELHMRWNLMNQHVFSNYDAAILEEAYTNPAIIHQKGWNYMSRIAVRKLYRKYRTCTPFPKIIYKDKTVKNIIKKIIGWTIEFLIGKYYAHKLKVLIQKEHFYSKARLN